MRVCEIPRLPAGALSAETLIGLRATHLFGTDTVPERQPALSLRMGESGAQTDWIDPTGLAGPP